MLPGDERDEYIADEAVVDAAHADPRRVPALAAGEFEQGDGYTASSGERTWRQEMPRWLATLNPGRTQHEYEKAVRYFFETPGVPAELSALSFDLLLAYRGSLALRATPHRDQPRAARHAPTRPALDGRRRDALPGERGAEDAGASDAAAGGTAPTPLSPATVNVRLTALRQFLTHCALFGWLPVLTPDRIRAALRRLSTERRRPYSVLAEPEWAQFLEAARLPATHQPPIDEAGEADATAKPARHGPWGVPRAVRRQAAEQAQREAAAEPSKSVERVEDVPLVHSRAGLTGAHTAQRDHALLALALATGLRAIELASLDLGDLSREWHAGREEWWLVLPDAKTKGQHGGRTLPLALELVESLLDYVGATGRSWDRAADRATPLFLSRRMAMDSVSEQATGDGATRRFGRLSPEHIRRIVDRVEAQWLALRGLQDGNGQGSLAADTRAISPHALRHSTAIALLEGNDVAGRPPASVEHVRGWLGHFDIRTTQGYLAHLESRRHRRPFTLAPMTETSTGAETPAEGADSLHDPATE